jgi:major membrane immunogen (membrane-anchored lipoprotein)
MKKFLSIFVLMMMAVATVTIISCSKDDDDDNSDPLEGEWDGNYYMKDGSTTAQGTVWIECENGKGEIYVRYYVNGSYKSEDATFSYTYDDNTITIKPKGGEKVKYDYELKEKKGTTKLYMTREEGRDYEETFELTKIDDDDYDDDDSYDDSYYSSFKLGLK